MIFFLFYPSFVFYSGHDVLTCTTTLNYTHTHTPLSLLCLGIEDIIISTLTISTLYIRTADMLQYNAIGFDALLSFFLFKCLSTYMASIW
jgi:hypothetical protein